MNKTAVVTLVIGVAIAGFVGLTIFTDVGARIENTQEWCNSHDGTVEYHNEVMYCDLPKKDVLSQDIVAQNYPDDTSQVPHTDMQTYQPTPTFDPIATGGLAIGIVALTLGSGFIAGTISRYRE